MLHFRDLWGEIQSRKKSGVEHAWSMVAASLAVQIGLMKPLVTTYLLVLGYAATQLPAAPSVACPAESSNSTLRSACLVDAAADLLFSGRNSEAERSAGRAVTILANNYGPTASVLLRPLHILASARIEQGKTGLARKAFEQMQAIPAETPEQRAMVHETAAALLHVQGRLSEALAECRAGIAELKEAGRGNTTDAASMLNSAAALDIAQKRFD